MSTWLNPLPLVSVIVPSYNYGHFIGQTLENLKAQSYQNWECIVVDDGSTDSTDEVVRSYAEKDSRIRLIQQQNGLQSVAKNNGIRNSVGKYIQFLDADDLLEAYKIEKQVEYLEQHPEVDIVYGSVRYFSTENRAERRYSFWGEEQKWMPEISGTGKDLLLALTRNNIMTINSPLVRRSVIEAVGLFDEELPPVEDWDYWIRCAAWGARFQFEDLEGTLALVRSHPSSSSRNRWRMSTSTSALRKKIKRLVTDADILKLNRKKSIEEQKPLMIEEVMNGSLSGRIYQIFVTGMNEGRMKQRMRWFICALVSPFVTRQQLRKMVTSPLIKSLMLRKAEVPDKLDR